jgi:hypothetical protein
LRTKWSWLWSNFGSFFRRSASSFSRFMSDTFRNINYEIRETKISQLLLLFLSVFFSSSRDRKDSVLFVFFVWTIQNVSDKHSDYSYLIFLDSHEVFAWNASSKELYRGRRRCDKGGGVCMVYI